jgi:hypothetical protein
MARYSVNRIPDNVVGTARWNAAKNKSRLCFQQSGAWLTSTEEYLMRHVDAMRAEVFDESTVEVTDTVIVVSGTFKPKWMYTSPNAKIHVMRAPLCGEMTYIDDNNRPVAMLYLNTFVRQFV